MDLSSYYDEFQSSYTLAICAVILYLFAVAFVGIRLWKSKKETKKTKIGCSVLLAVIFLFVINYFIARACPTKKDIEEKTIFYYEGSFEIIEISQFIYHEAVFSFENQEITLKYPQRNSKYDMIQPGKYEGKFVYAQHLGYVLDFELYDKQVD